MDSFYYEGDIIDREELVSSLLPTALTNMKYLKSYSVDLCSALQPILDAMNANDVQLEVFGFLVINQDSIETAFIPVQTSQSTSSISSLKIKFTDAKDVLGIINPLTDLCHSLKNLASLMITSYCSHQRILLLDILENLRILKNLEFNGLVFEEETTDDQFYNIVTNDNNFYNENLQSIRVSKFGVEGSHNLMQKPNLLFSFILRSCPNVKKIELNARDINTRGKSNLDFRGNHHLRQISIDMPKCRYYTFRRKSMKRSVVDIILHQSKNIAYHTKLIWLGMLLKILKYNWADVDYNLSCSLPQICTQIAQSI